MFIMSVRISPKRMLAGALALVLVVSGGIVWGRLASRDDTAVSAGKTATENKSEVPDKKEKSEKIKESEDNKTQKAKKTNIKKAPAKTNEQRLEFIQSFGWEVEAEPVEIMEVIIPKEFDEVYGEYNSIQKLQGFDLADYAGKRCKRYSYKIVNYPDAPENARINLLVQKNKIIGGDVCSLDANGFMHGFAAE